MESYNSRDSAVRDSKPLLVSSGSFAYAVHTVAKTCYGGSISCCCTFLLKKEQVDVRHQIEHFIVDMQFSIVLTALISLASMAVADIRDGFVRSPPGDPEGADRLISLQAGCTEGAVTLCCACAGCPYADGVCPPASLNAGCPCVKEPPESAGVCQGQPPAAGLVC